MVLSDRELREINTAVYVLRKQALSMIHSSTTKGVYQKAARLLDDDFLHDFEGKYPQAMVNDPATRAEENQMLGNPEE